jgi:hypothetical protein
MPAGFFYQGRPIAARRSRFGKSSADLSFLGRQPFDNGCEDTQDEGASNNLGRLVKPISHQANKPHDPSKPKSDRQRGWELHQRRLCSKGVV